MGDSSDHTPVRAVSWGVGLEVAEAGGFAEALAGVSRELE
jgi:hypothetical protein